MKNRIFQVEAHNPLAKQIIGLGMKVHRTLGHGFVETIYRNALIVELRNAQIPYECHVSLPIMYEGVEVGVFQADLIISKQLIVELKAVDAYVEPIRPSWSITWRRRKSRRDFCSILGLEVSNSKPRRAPIVPGNNRPIFSPKFR
jgi:GxxExxY protein